MTSRVKLTALILVLAVAMTVVGMFISSGPKAAPGPYQSALSTVGVASAEAASHKCANRMCEFASPGFVCTEGSGTTCQFGNGCTTVSCR